MAARNFQPLPFKMTHSIVLKSGYSTPAMKLSKSQQEQRQKEDANPTHERNQARLSHVLQSKLAPSWKVRQRDILRHLSFSHPSRRARFDNAASRPSF